MSQITRKLDAYSDALAPLREASNRYLKHPSVLQEDGVMNIGHRPWVAELNYMFMLYPGIDSDSLVRYSKRFRIEIPEIYAGILRQLNGAFCFGVSFCGIPLSMLGDPPLLNRRILQCRDLAAEATMPSEYRVPVGLFRFGGRHFSYTENVAYFFDEGNRILCIRKTGKVLAEWASFAKFLADELEASEELEEKLHPWR